MGTGWVGVFKWNVAPVSHTYFLHLTTAIATTVSQGRGWIVVFEINFLHLTTYVRERVG